MEVEAIKASSNVLNLPSLILMLFQPNDKLVQLVPQRCLLTENRNSPIPTFCCTLVMHLKQS